MFLPPLKSRSLAVNLQYRAFITVQIILKDRNIFKNNWIYVHDPRVQVSRIQNAKSWSLDMIPDPSTLCLGMEYFCQEGDVTWKTEDNELIRIAVRELEILCLASTVDVLDGFVVRQSKAYPVYDENYAKIVDAIRIEINTHYNGLHLIGRNGMHRYNNQDHAMMTAILTVENIIADRMIYDVWKVNQDAEYHEDLHPDRIPSFLSSPSEY